MKKILSTLCSMILLLSFSTPTFASDTENSTNSDLQQQSQKEDANDPAKLDVKIPDKVETVSVRDIVPAKYFEAVKGKYKSKEEILKATGFTLEKSVKPSTVQLSEGAMTVDDLDEYAALLTYYSDSANQNFKVSSIQPTAVESHSNTDTVWGDGLAAGKNLSWIEATVYYNRDSATRNITKVTGSTSTLLGFHPGNSWAHDRVATDNSASLKGRAGNIQIKGTRTLSIIIGGIGDITSRSESYFMGLG
ncbi:hypothetical protein ACIFQM_23205 [Paenibacillus sp. NRS-1782]|uniref:hypothetical protein n=1 Tax=unclassified Paenibacillus TaxID=185978 RepID=UPI003D2DD11C